MNASCTFRLNAVAVRSGSLELFSNPLSMAWPRPFHSYMFCCHYSDGVYALAAANLMKDDSDLRVIEDSVEVSLETPVISGPESNVEVRITGLPEDGVEREYRLAVHLASSANSVVMQAVDATSGDVEVFFVIPGVRAGEVWLFRWQYANFSFRFFFGAGFRAKLL